MGQKPNVRQILFSLVDLMARSSRSACLRDEGPAGAGPNIHWIASRQGHARSADIKFHKAWAYPREVRKWLVGCVRYSHIRNEEALPGTVASAESEAGWKIK